MGLPRGFVMRVFSKCLCSSSMQEGNDRRYGVDKSRWSAVRLYLCGDEFNSVLAEDNLTSHRHSEVTTLEPAAEPSGDEETHPLIEPEEIQKTNAKEERTPSSQEDAAILIQSAFRGFLARKQYQQLRRKDEGCELNNLENSSAILETMSTEVQLDDSVYSFSVEEERVQSKVRTQVFRPKEEWDDSTVSSNILKMRIQSKLEASTRREKALAYAFSQQLRTCTAKKRSAKSDTNEPNMGWSWLERWMAARQPEISLVQDNFSRKYEPNSCIQRPIIIQNGFDKAVEEKESCGSNDVSVNLDTGSSPSQAPTLISQSNGRSRLKVMRSVPRRKPMPDYRCSRGPNKVSKRRTEKVVDTEKRHREAGELKSLHEIQARDAFEAPSDY